MDYRAPMTRVEFDAIPVDPSYPVDELWSSLLGRNPRLSPWPPIEQFTSGCRWFLVLYVFDSQVCNGGITQFFWNYPQLVSSVEEALTKLGEAELHALFTRAVETVLGKRADWTKLREEAYRNPTAPDWEPFRQSYDLLDLNWFDKAYYDRSGFDEQQKWVVLAEGLQLPFLRRLAAWVKAHPDEFITG